MLTKNIGIGLLCGIILCQAIYIILCQAICWLNQLNHLENENTRLKADMVTVSMRNDSHKEEVVVFWYKFMDFVAASILTVLLFIVFICYLQKTEKKKGLQVAATDDEGLSETHLNSLSFETPLIDTIEGSGQEQHLVVRTKISLPSRDQDSGLESLVAEYSTVTSTSLEQPDEHRAIYCTEDHPFGTYFECFCIGRLNTCI